MKIGLDIGSTTLKCVVMSESGELLYLSYERHFSDIVRTALAALAKIHEKFGEEEYYIAISGSAGMGIAETCGITFVQEVYATRCAVKKYLKDIDTVVELGGEDAKILFLNDGNGNESLEVRMNGSCAGGTGAFIDQMATLLNITPTELNELAKSREKIYTVASRCGVFAKSDIQPLLNQGAKKEDVAASIFYAVVNQTVAGLAQGRTIEGNVLYLGGPLHYFSQLREAFDDTLKITGICPENSLYYVALGAALSPDIELLKFEDIISKIENYTSVGKYNACKPLFASNAEYNDFLERHSKECVPTDFEYNADKNYYIGIDAGSTTVKMAVVDDDMNIIYTSYLPNSGNPVPLVKQSLEDLYGKYPDIKIAATASTGYGEELIKAAFCVDYGLVETMAHFYAARFFSPNINFILDIGGQDIKCFKIHNGTIDSIFLNEACSSGCGSFLQTFAGALGYGIQDFAKLGLFADNPADLGSRCTVFMNSAVKQAQKDGASIENISAGLSISVVKNALYKVIRAGGPDSLGKNIVVQGGTFLNDAVLRAFENETGCNVIRPNIAGLMGAFGAALYAKNHNKSRSDILTPQGLSAFEHTVKAITCNGCSNSCKLTLNYFNDGRKLIGGNRCQKPITKQNDSDTLNMYTKKSQLLEKYKSTDTGKIVIGLPMTLNMFELLPFWHTFFIKLGYDVKISPPSNRKLYLKGQHTIPSDTVCFPAKLVHGHIEELLEAGVKNIFQPCMTYNFNEGTGHNYYNCPVVAYYSEVIKGNVKEIGKINYIYDNFGLDDRKYFPKKILEILNKRLDEKITLKQVKEASKAAYSEYDWFMKELKVIGQEIISKAKEEKLPIIALVGRPYHLDPEVNHGIDKLICGLGAAVITEDVLSCKDRHIKTNVLNQWTYHARMYSTADYIANSSDNSINLVQMVSFGCGLDAVTTDEIRGILERNGKTYTQIKIDEITNLGAVKIRIRSLMESASDREDANAVC
ncbi:acyl-CoA dehydratase activase-related protein [Eubacteriales bacterium OttesenSCG-928-G02]|nr:acyl-CoA dehydratase activase-related protein [Eubacteriales bacterium OttesenSCG-928-G02]